MFLSPVPRFPERREGSDHPSLQIQQDRLMQPRPHNCCGCLGLGMVEFLPKRCLFQHGTQENDELTATGY